MKFDLSSLKTTFSNMLDSKVKAVTQNIPSRNYRLYSSFRRDGPYQTTEQIEEIIQRGNPEELIALSRHYFNTNGLYRRIILYLSTMLLYETMINPKFVDKKPNKKTFLRSYTNAINFVDKMNLPQEFSRIFTIMLVDGVYYGLAYESPNGSIIFGDLPRRYCRTRFRSNNGNQLLEFNVTFFDSLSDSNEQQLILSNFPKEILDFYNLYKAGEVSTSWYIVPEEIGVAFTGTLDGNSSTYTLPFLIQTIPAISKLHDYEKADLDSVQNELSKLIINRIPLDDENELAFELPEVEEIHRGIANMVKDNQHLDVITTFTDTQVASLGSTVDTVRNDLNTITHLVYNEAGVSKQLFDNDSAISISYSIQNDLALVTQLLKPLQRWLTFKVNQKFAKIENFFYEVNILPISHYNREEMSKLYLQGAQYGYSKMLAGVALGVKQSDLIALVEVENNMLDLTNRMVPLQSSYTSSYKDNRDSSSSSSSDSNSDSEEGGRPQKEEKELSEETVANKETKV